MQGKCVFTRIRRIEYFVRSANVFLYVQRALPLLLTIGFLNSISTARYTRCDWQVSFRPREGSDSFKRRAIPVRSDPFPQNLIVQSQCLPPKKQSLHSIVLVSPAWHSDLLPSDCKTKLLHRSSTMLPVDGR